MLTTILPPPESVSTLPPSPLPGPATEPAPAPPFSLTPWADVVGAIVTLADVYQEVGRLTGDIDPVGTPSRELELGRLRLARAPDDVREWRRLAVRLAIAAELRILGLEAGRAHLLLSLEGRATPARGVAGAADRRATLGRTAALATLPAPAPADPETPVQRAHAVVAILAAGLELAAAGAL